MQHDSLVDDLLNTLDAGRLIGVSGSTLARYRSENTGPAYVKIGGKVRYRRSDLEAWITTIEPEGS